ncbi:hypothetical protein GCM10010215_25340 [Streptomyces virginiae]|uniref:TnsA endonuclease N-terminal domain-containing protein n=2 Tax=Streptomyces virginiae TaxID=1961 RepID=A0ABQ3NND0_STRVG|nr:hypothetical protein GCM10010215_25340 [Streptomyces virginiae]GHI14287.1 hypothetical protein Scinn_37500 [Streptomyces virginiae]
MRDHVIYESRLELTRLLFADFDPCVRRILAQPFLLKAVLEGKVRKHIPDYLLITEQGPLVVDVKPSGRLPKPEVAFTVAWTRQVVESRGWEYEVWSEPPAVSWRTSGSWRATAGTGCSVPSSWTSFAVLNSMAFSRIKPQAPCRPPRAAGAVRDPSPSVDRTHRYRS